jgi:hypothetical protein
LMIRVLITIAALWSITVSAVAQPAPPSPPSTAILGGNTSLSVTTLSNSVLLPASATQFPVTLLINDGAVEAFAVFGGVSVTATTSGIPIPPCSALPVWNLAASNYVAGITGSGSTTLRLLQFNGQPLYSAACGSIVTVSGAVTITGALPAGTNNIGTVTTTPTAVTAAVSSAIEASHIFKTGAATLYSWGVGNGAAVSYVMVFDSATVPANGTIGSGTCTVACRLVSLPYGVSTGGYQTEIEAPVATALANGLTIVLSSTPFPTLTIQTGASNLGTIIAKVQ